MRKKLINKNVKLIAIDQKIKPFFILNLTFKLTKYKSYE